ncbi:MAG TPA: hypothetical protein VHO06_14405 [Polyangia bacterium]|nr:hypothetical protein [Polyangia bacterium]
MSLIKSKIDVGLSALDSWRRCCGDIAPVGFLLRRDRPERWLRVHYFEDERRAPTSPGELSRAVEIVLALVERIVDSFDSLLILVLAHDLPARTSATGLGLTQISNVPDGWIKLLDEYADTSALSVHAGLLAQRDRDMGQLVEAVAKRKIEGATVLNPASCEALCLYDGGVDVFVADSSRRQVIAVEFEALARV